MPAATYLTRYRSPWLVKTVTEKIIFTEKMTKKAVIWLCKKVNKPILRLNELDYEDNGLL